MKGEPWDETFLFVLGKLWHDLPYSVAVMDVIFDQADFLDANPEYRGLPALAKGRVHASRTEAD
jgi:hypothetical protein